MTQPTTIQVQGAVVVMPLEEYDNIQMQLNELRTKIEDFEDIRDMLLALQADEDEVMNYEDYRQQRLTTNVSHPSL